MGQKFGIWEFRSQKYLKYPYLPLFINVTRSKLSKFCMFLSLLAKYQNLSMGNICKINNIYFDSLQHILSQTLP